MAYLSFTVVETEHQNTSTWLLNVPWDSFHYCGWVLCWSVLRDNQVEAVLPVVIMHHKSISVTSATFYLGPALQARELRGYTGSCAENGPLLHLMHSCHRLEILHNICERGPTIFILNGPCKLHSQS